MIKLQLITALFLASFTTIAQVEMNSIPLNDDNLLIAQGTKHSYEIIDGKNTLVLNGRVQLKNTIFKNGTIEVEVLANSKRSFAGITFRKQDDTFEEVYLRMHKSGAPDALQYNPVFNIESNWQLYPEYQALALTKREGWNKLKIIIGEDIAEILVNGKKVLTVEDLKTDQKEGNIGLFALFENRFANLKFTTSGSVSSSNEKETKSMAGLITEWQLSEPKAYNPKEDLGKHLNITNTITGKVEESGLLPISKYVVKPSRGKYRRNNEDFVIATATVNSDSEGTKLYTFDYSDKIEVYLNGKMLFKGNNGFLFKNNQYQGHLKLETNTIPLELKKGENVLQCIVIERANGWGLMGKITD